MAIFNMTGGGGGVFNFTVKNGTTAPAAPKENTIWVKTADKITGWVIDIKRPQNPAEGMVWIRTGTETALPINAHKKQAMMLYLEDAQRYASGVWSACEMKVYINGAWVGDRDKNILLLLHGENVIDYSTNNVALSNTGVTVSNAQSKFGGQSLRFDGSSYLTISTAILLDYDNFTVEWWEYREKSTEGECLFFAQASSGSSYGLNLGYIKSSLYTTNASNNGTTWNLFSDIGMGSNITGRWVHRAFVKSGTSYYWFEDGVMTNQTTNAKTLTSLKGNIVIGKKMTGYIDELCISKVAKWSSGFTPPTRPYR